MADGCEHLLRSVEQDRAVLQESACAPHLGGADELAAPYQYFTAHRGLEAGTGAVRRSGGQAVGCEARVRAEGAQRGREALVNRAVGCAERSEGGGQAVKSSVRRADRRITDRRCLPLTARPPIHRTAGSYSVTGGQTHTRFRSPYAPSTRPTDGHTLCRRVAGEGNAARSREYGRSQASPMTSSSVCGAWWSRLLSRGLRPSSISRISSWIAIRGSLDRSSPSLLALSVGSIIKVPATGNETVGG